MLNYLNTRHKRKSAALTTVVMTLLFIALFVIGLRYLEPPLEYGIAVNFGTSSVGHGNIQPTEPVRTEPREVVSEEVPEQTETTETSQPEETVTEPEVTEDVVTQDNEEAIAIKKEEERKKKAAEEARKAKLEEERIERERQEEIARKKAEEDAKREKLDALIGGINDADGKASGGEGNDNVAGDKGKETGDPNASGYYGNGGDGGGGDYQLGNRRPLSRPKPNYICDEEGLVVVSIEVDVNGRVLKATPGVKGSTNTATCLLTQAKDAALKTRWQPDAKAPAKQVGTIKYRFSLSQ